MAASGGTGQGVPRAPQHEPGPGFFDGVRRQGIRRGHDRWLGGVASGVAQRAGVPPLAVRAVFVFLALVSGLGFFAYGLAWALLPEEDGRIHAEGVAQGRWSAGMTGAVVMALLGLSDTGPNPVLAPWGDWWFFWPLVWVAAVAAVVYLVISHTRAGTASPAGLVAAHPLAPVSQNVPPRQHGWDAPGTPLVAVVSGTAVIVAGVTLLLASAGATDLARQAVAVAWAAAAAVVGLGIVVAGLVGRRSGTLGFLAVAALVSAGLTAGFNAPGNVAVGRTFNWAPESASALMDGYSIAAGSGELDLRSLAAAGPLPSDTTLAVNAAASTVAVLIPADIPVRISSRVAFGTVQYNDGGNTTGIWNPEERTFNPDAPGGTLILDLHGAFSAVSITVRPD